MGQALKIFLSYSRKDVGTARKIYLHLVEAGYDVWMDTQSIIGGNPWRQEIVEAIEASALLLVALSPNAIKSDNIRKELDLAESSGKPIVPVMIGEVSIPAAMKYQLAGIRLVDLSRDLDAGLRMLSTSLQHISAESTAAKPPEFKTPGTQVGFAKDLSTDEIFSWKGHEMVIRSELMPEYLWMATNTSLFIDGQQVVTAGGMRENVAGHATRTFDNKAHTFELEAKTGDESGQFYSLSVDGIEIRNGHVPIRNKGFSYLRDVVIILVILLIVARILNAVVEWFFQ